MLYHIAEVARWDEACASGTYTASTLGLELDAVGFIHLCTAEQLDGVAARFYRGVEGLVLLHIDGALLDAPVVMEAVGDSGELFPHLYGPLKAQAVVAAEPFTAPD
jgi:uncharacterized protein (DUF952 family)